MEIAEEHEVSAAQVSLAWLMGRPGVASVIVGARTEEQLADNLGAAELRLTDEEREPTGRSELAASTLSVLASGENGLRPAQRRRPLIIGASFVR